MDSTLDEALCASDTQRVTTPGPASEDSVYRGDASLWQTMQANVTSAMI